MSDLGVFEVAGWRFKTYGISFATARPRPELVDAAHALADWLMALISSGAPETGATTFGVGFIGVHDGRDGCLVFVDWWADDNELHHHVFTSSRGAPWELVDRTGTGLVACVFDLEVLDFERRAWIETVLANPAGPDLEAYLARRLVVDVPAPGGRRTACLACACLTCVTPGCTCG